MKRNLMWLLFLPMLCFFGCQQQEVDLESEAVIKAIAFDRAEEGFLMTALMQDPSTDGSSGSHVVSVQSTSMITAFTKLSASVSRMPFTGQNEIILISDEIEPYYFKMIAEYFYFYSRNGGDEEVVFMKGEAKRAFEETKGFYDDISIDLINTLDNAEQYSGYKKSSIRELVNASEGVAKALILPYAKVEESIFSVFSGAVIKEYTHLGDLSSYECMAAEWLYTGTGKKDYLEIPVTDGFIGIRIDSMDATNKITIQNKTVHCDSKLILTFTIEEESGKLSKPDIESEVEAFLKSQLCFDYEKVKIMRADFMGLAVQSLNKGLSFEEEHAPDWSDMMGTLSYDISAEATLVLDAYPKEGWKAE